MMPLGPQPQLDFPVLGQGTYVGCTLKQVWFVRFVQEKRGDARDGNAMGITAQDLDTRPRTNLARLDNRKIEPTSATRQKALDHVVSPEPESQLIAGHPGLSDHQNGGPGPQTVADTKAIFQEPFGGQILAEHAEGK